jgi:hypothetical protein
MSTSSCKPAACALFFPHPDIAQYCCTLALHISCHANHQPLLRCAGPSQSPVIAASDDTYTIRAAAGKTTSRTLFVLQNDTGSGSLTLLDVTPAPAGSTLTGIVQISADKQAIEYAVDYDGKPFTEAFRYRVRDETGATSSARMEVSVGESVAAACCGCAAAGAA